MQSRKCARKNATIYIVDARASARDEIRRLFSAASLPMREYESAESFLADLTETPRGCLICQLDLPGMNGLALLEQLKAHGYRLPSIVLAQEGDIATAVRSMKAGAIDFIEHAAPDARLVQRAKEALERRT